nr:MAG TPA: hypothetical protein [Caudoviricetes sp.]
MSKAALISIRPKWCEKICNGKKTIEVRKTRPKLETPFKCYIYCTQARERLITILKDGDENYGEIYRGKPVFIKTDEGSVCDMWGKRQKVIGEFDCDDIYEIDPTKTIGAGFAEDSCVSSRDIHEYLGGQTGYGWHIFDLKIYDKPKELSEFTFLRETKFGSEPVTIKRPPQSWRYVEEQK